VLQLAIIDFGFSVVQAHLRGCRRRSAADLKSRHPAVVCNGTSLLRAQPLCGNSTRMTFALPGVQLRTDFLCNVHQHRGFVTHHTCASTSPHSSISDSAYIHHCLQREITSEDLRQHFSEYGNIEDAVIVADQNGVSRGFGFVTYDNTISIEKALIVRHQFGDRVVDCKRAVPKEEINRQQVRCIPVDHVRFDLLGVAASS
jgi:hypothetical protein